MQARAVLITVLGIPICTAILVGFPIVALYGPSQGLPFTRGDWIMGAVLSAGALVVVGLAVRVWLRIRRERTAQDQYVWLARAVPLLVAGGVALGILFPIHAVRSAARSARETAAQTVEWDCRSALGHGRPASELAACRPVARACRELARLKPAPRDEFYPSGLPSDPVDRATVRCLQARLGEKGGTRSP